MGRDRRHGYLILKTDILEALLSFLSVVMPFRAASRGRE